MRIYVRNRIIHLLNNDVKSSRKNCTRILKNIRDVAYKHNRYSYYLTFLIIMHVMTGDLIEQFDPDVLEAVFSELRLKDKENADKRLIPPNQSPRN